MHVDPVPAAKPTSVFVTERRSHAGSATHAGSPIGSAPRCAPTRASVWEISQLAASSWSRRSTGIVVRKAAATSGVIAASSSSSTSAALVIADLPADVCVKWARSPRCRRSKGVIPPLVEVNLPFLALRRAFSPRGRLREAKKGLPSGGGDWGDTGDTTSYPYPCTHASG